MIRALLVTLALVGVAGCKKSAPPSKADQAIAKLVGFTDRACACTDVKCVHLAQKELAEWLIASGAELNTLKFTPAQDAAGKKTSDDMAKCVEKMNKAAAQTLTPE